MLSILLKLKKRKKYYSFAPYIGTKIQIHIDNNKEERDCNINDFRYSSSSFFTNAGTCSAISSTSATHNKTVP